MKHELFNSFVAESVSRYKLLLKAAWTDKANSVYIAVNLLSADSPGSSFEALNRVPLKRW